MVLMVSQVGGNQTRYLRQAHANKFIISELCYFSFPERINNHYIVPLWRIYIIRCLADVMLRQRLVDLMETLVISGNCDVQQLVAVSKLTTCYRLDAVFLAFKDEVDDSHCIVDVGQRHRWDMHTPRLLHQILNGDGAETQAVI